MYIGNVMTESLAVLDNLPPASQAAGVVNGNAIDMSVFNRLLFLLDVGVISATGTVDFKIQVSLTPGFASPINLAGKAISQMTQAGGSGNQLCKVGMTAEDLQNATGVQAARYARYVLTVGAAPAIVSVVAMGAAGRQKPENAYDIAGVVQTIADAS